MNTKYPFAPLYRTLTLVTAAFGTVGGIFLYLTYTKAFDTDIQHFEYTCPLWIISCGAYMLGMVLVLVNVFASRKKVSLAGELSTGVAEVFFGYFAAVLLAICFMREVGLLTAVEEMSPLGQAAAYTSVLPPLYFLVSNLSKKNSLLSALMAFGAVIAVVLSMFRDYFNLELPLNGSVRILTTVTSSAMLLFLLSEARLQIDPERSTVPAFILANGSAGLFLTTAGLAQAVFAFTDPNSTFDVLPQAAMAAVGALAFCRMYRGYKSFGPYKAPENSKTEKTAQKNGQ